MNEPQLPPNCRVVTPLVREVSQRETGSTRPLPVTRRNRLHIVIERRAKESGHDDVSQVVAIQPSIIGNGHAQLLAEAQPTLEELLVRRRAAGMDAKSGEGEVVEGHAPT